MASVVVKALRLNATGSTGTVGLRDTDPEGDP